MRRQIVIGLLALALAACTGLPFQAQAPKVRVADVDIKSLGLLEQRFDVSLKVDNPNDFDLKIEGLEFDLEVNGRPFAKGGSQDAALIPAASGAVLHVEAVTRSRDLVGQLKALPPQALEDGIPYRIEGRVKTDRTGWLPFRHEGRYGGNRKPPATETRI